MINGGDPRIYSPRPDVVAVLPDTGFIVPSYLGLAILVGVGPQPVNADSANNPTTRLSNDNRVGITASPYLRVWIGFLRLYQPCIFSKRRVCSLGCEFGREISG